MSVIATLSYLPAPVLVLIGVLICVQIVFDTVALRDLYRRPVSEVTFGNKWLWVAIILVITSVLGAILYLVFGRKPAPATHPLTPHEVHANEAMDLLYATDVDRDL